MFVYTKHIVIYQINMEIMQHKVMDSSVFFFLLYLLLNMVTGTCFILFQSFI